MACTHTHINQTSWQGDRAAKIKKWKPAHEREKDGERTNENEPLRTHDNKWVQRVKNVHDTNQQTNRRRQRIALGEKKMGVSKNKSGRVASVRCFEWNANVLHFIWNSPLSRTSKCISFYTLNSLWLEAIYSLHIKVSEQRVCLIFPLHIIIHFIWLGIFLVLNWCWRHHHQCHQHSHTITARLVAILCIYNVRTASEQVGGKLWCMRGKNRQ